MSARLRSWGSSWITLWILPAAARAPPTWDIPATTGSDAKPRATKPAGSVGSRPRNPSDPQLNLLIYDSCVFRAPDDDDGGPYAGVQDSQEVCTTSFSTSPPSQVRGHSLLPLPLYSPFSYLLFISLPLFSLCPFSVLSSFYRVYLCVCRSGRRLSVCVHAESFAL